MAVPKKKTSKMKTRSRRSSWKASTPTIVECPECHAPKVPHRVCSNCGFYNKKEVLASEE